MNEFIYRQIQRLKYHISSDNMLKRIAEINANKPIINISKDAYIINEINLSLPKREFDFVFGRVAFKHLINNQKLLDGVYEFANNTLYFSFDEIKVAITSASELYIINEIYIEQCYNFKLPDKGKSIVIDIGMNVGLASLFFAFNNQIEKVHSFEPFEPTFRLAENNFALNSELSMKIHRYNFGLTNGDKTIEVSFDPENKGVNSTTYAKGNKIDTSIEKVELKDAATIITSLCNDYTSVVLKVDTEGGEYEIFESLAKGGIPKNIKIVMLEWHFLGSLRLEKFLIAENFICFSLRIDKDSGLIYAVR